MAAFPSNYLIYEDQTRRERKTKEEEKEGDPA